MCFDDFCLCLRVLQHGQLPLHAALNSEADVRVVKALLEAFPEGASTADQVRGSALRATVYVWVSCACVFDGKGERFHVSFLCLSTMDMHF